MDTSSHWPQGIGVVKGVETSSKLDQRKPRPQKEQAINCPRCNSTNTKFCYYNNYSLSQPRYFCKTCRRYWTEGGSLRNVPVGGGSRKNKRSNNNNNNNSSSSSTSSSKKLLLANPNDLNLTYNPIPNSTSFACNVISSFSDFMASHPSVNSAYSMNMPNSNLLYTSASSTAGLPDLKPSSINFCLDGLDNQEAKLFDLKINVSTANDDHQFEENRGQEEADHQSNGFWNGMLGGGESSW